MYDNNVMEVVENILNDVNIIGTKWAFLKKIIKRKRKKKKETSGT